jgi:hypothetical protein
MRGVVGLAAVVVILACTGCAAPGFSESELASQTQVVQQAAPSSATPVVTVTPSAAVAQASATVIPSPWPTTKQPVPVGTEVGGGEVVGSGPCELVAVDEVTVYERPHIAAEVFGTMVEGFRVQPQARTADGWWGFDPAVAQAANVGVFRLRWVQETAAVRLEGSCGEVPEVVAPPPGVCFTMPMEDVQVLASPDPSAEVVATLGPGDYAEVLGTSTDGWAQVDLASGSTGLAIRGWVPVGTLNMNGPCENLPTFEPQ